MVYRACAHLVAWYGPRSLCCSVHGRLDSSQALAAARRWLTAEHPDPDGYHTRMIANFLKSYLGKGHGLLGVDPHRYMASSPLYVELFKPLKLAEPDCALFWDFTVLWQKSNKFTKEWDDRSQVLKTVQIDERNEEQKAQFDAGLRASNLWYGHMHALTLVQPALPATDDRPEGFAGTTYHGSGWV